ncbi:MAG TPA: hypothetical protein EYQ84_02085 [Nitrospinaceae bacterium]|nr:hypothetical protein [Nitrospinaceae bacterium]
MQVRKATIDDHLTVMAICNRNGLNLCMSQDKWVKFWKFNPHILENPDFPIGWILHADNKHAVGVLINIPLVYELNGKRLLGVAGSSWAVDAQYRKASFLLIMKYFQQKDVDFFMNSTANEASGSVFQAFKARRVPCSSYDQVLLWIVDYLKFSRSALLKKRIPLVDILQYPAGFILWCINHVLKYNYWARVSTQVVHLKKFDQRFDIFWKKLRKKENRLLATRDQAALNWHFRIARSEEEIKVLISLDRDEIVGYVILANADNKGINLKRFQIVDFQLLDENSNVAKDLLCGALQYAKKSGASLVECVGFSGMKRDYLERLSLHRRKLVPYPFYFKPALEGESVLNNPSLWDPCSYDGDTSLFTRKTNLNESS